MTHIDPSDLVDAALRASDPLTRSACEREALASGDASAMLAFARDVPGADVCALGEAVIFTGDVHAMTSFARHVPGADIARLARAVRREGSAAEIARFAFLVLDPGADEMRGVLARTS